MDKSTFFAAIPPLKRELVDLPNGTHVFVRQLTVGERDRIEIALSKQGKGVEGIRAQMIIAAVVDEQGVPLFGEEDYQTIVDLPVRYVEPILEKIQAYNAITDEDIRDLAGKSEASPS